jgi:hypothetical protein
MFAVGTGYNSLFVTLGIFDTKELLEETLKSMGATWREPRTYTAKDKDGKEVVRTSSGRWIASKEFCKSMHDLGLSAYEMDGLSLDIKELTPNKITLGYDTD